MIGRSSAFVLHRIASQNFAKYSNYRFIRFWLVKNLYADSEAGVITSRLGMTTELIGVLLTAPMWSFALSSTEASAVSFNGNSVLFVGASITFGLYLLSFRLHQTHAAKALAPHHHASDSCADVRATGRCLPNIREVIAVSAGDMASLLAEQHGSSTPLLNRRRDRTFSEISNFSDMMERGEASLKAK
jgi:hypothetical protein